MSYNIYSNIKSKSGLSAAQLAAAEKAFSPSNGYHADVWQAIVDAEHKYGINALFILAHADVESAHGNSYYARTRNNLFGFNAIDSNPDNASSYSSQAAAIDYYASFLERYYLTPGAVYYNGTTPHGVFVRYSSSHDSEANTVAQIMNALQSHIGSKPTPAPAPTPAPVTKGSYRVQSGDNLTKISKNHPGTNPDMWVKANKSKYPQITRDYIQAGWLLAIPGGHPSVVHPAPAGGAQYIRVPSGRNGYLSVLAAKYHTSTRQLISWNKAKYPTIGTGPDAHIEAGWVIRVK